MSISELDPQIQQVLAVMAAQPQPDEPPSLDEIRAGASAGHRALCPPVAESVDVRHVTVPGPNGDIPCIVNKPDSSSDALPIVVYYHGGGLMLLGADEFQPLCTALAAQAECIVVNVDYRLAPEHPFPQPLDDAYAAYLWACGHATELGGDPARIAVAGDSAGGYLSTAVCLDARAKGGPQPVHQMLVYPAVDMTNRSEGMLTIDAFVNFDMILGMNAAHCAGHELDPRASPIHADDHRGLAPATIVAASYDPLADQGRAYAAALRRSDVPVTYRCYDGTIHAFLTMGGAVDIANTAVEEIAADLRAVFA
jgi:acetyl esterase/lipase